MAYMNASAPSLDRNADGRVLCKRQPEIEVEHPVDFGLVDGTSVVDFGSVNVGQSVTKDFRIRNLGNGTLASIGTSIGGVNSAEFAVTVSPPVSIGTGNSATFSVTFTPFGASTKRATLFLENNDANENPFDIVLTGIGMTPRSRFDQAAAMAGLAGPLALPDAEPFQDGYSNLLKYAFNLQMSSASSSGTGGIGGMPTSSLTGSGQQLTVKVIFVRRIGSGLVYTPKKSRDLTASSWTAITVAPVVTRINSEWEQLEYTENLSVSEWPRCFTTVTVTLPE